MLCIRSLERETREKPPAQDLIAEEETPLDGYSARKKIDGSSLPFDFANA